MIQNEIDRLFEKYLNYCKLLNKNKNDFYVLKEFLDEEYLKESLFGD